MKRILPLLLSAILICSCHSLETSSPIPTLSDNPPMFHSATSTDKPHLIHSTTSPDKPPLIHWELMNDKSEDQLGNEPYILVLPITYRTDGTDSICIANIQHAADVANGIADTNHVEFPYIKYAYLVDTSGIYRFNTWVYVSMRLIPKDTADIEAWMLEKSREYHSQGLIVDSTENTATLFKLKWKSTSLL